MGFVRSCCWDTEKELQNQTPHSYAMGMPGGATMAAFAKPSGSGIKRRDYGEFLGRFTNPELGEGLVDWTIDLPAEGHRLKGTYESLKLTEGRRGQRWVSFRKPCIV